LGIYKTIEGACGSKLLYFSVSNIAIKPNGKTVLIMPGYSCKILSSYNYSLATSFYLKGYTVIICDYGLFSQGHHVDGVNKINYTENLYHNSLLIKDLHKDQDRYIIGISLGANTMATFLGKDYNIDQRNGEQIYKAAISIDNPFDFLKQERYFRNTLIELLFVYNFNDSYSKLLNKFYGQTSLHWSKNSIKDYEYALVEHLYGEKCLESYLIKNSSVHVLDNIQLPMLVLNSRDDPISNIKAIPRNQLISKKNIIYIESSHGSHTCYLYLTKNYKFKQWFVEPCLAFLDCF
jgi:predicted alpha/beta-fold hydrolase